MSSIRFGRARTRAEFGEVNVPNVPRARAHKSANANTTPWLNQAKPRSSSAEAGSVASRVPLQATALQAKRLGRKRTTRDARKFGLKASVRGRSAFTRHVCSMLVPHACTQRQARARRSAASRAHGDCLRFESLRCWSKPLAQVNPRSDFVGRFGRGTARALDKRHSGAVRAYLSRAARARCSRALLARDARAHAPPPFSKWTARPPSRLLRREHRALEETVGEDCR